MKYKRLAAYALVIVVGVFTANSAVVAYGVQWFGVEAASVVGE